MMLYYCPDCGHWQDVRFFWWLSTHVENFAKAMNQEPPVRPKGFACPKGHGMMVQVQAHDCIMLRPTPTEAIFPPSLVLLKTTRTEESGESHG